MTTTPPPGLILFLGMARRGEFETLLARGLPLGILVDTNSRHQLGDVSEFKFVERFDFSRPLSELIAAVRAIQHRHGIACLFNLIEYYVAQAAQVAEALGLPGIAPESARLCMDKCVMRERFQDRIGAGAAARFQVADSEGELLETAARFGYPVFLQPSNLAASMWSTRNTSPEMLLANYRAMVREVPRYYASLGKPEFRLSAVLAEFIEGPNTSVDCLADAAGQVYPMPVVDVLTGRDVGIDDFHHFARVLPSGLTAAEQTALRQLAIAGVRALDMRTCAAHVEFIGTRLGEIAARPGGNRARLMELAGGIDEIHAYSQVLRGEIPDLGRQFHRGAAILTPFAHRNGTLSAIRHLARLGQLPGYLYHEVRAQPGQPVGLAQSGFRAPLYIELVSPDVEAVRRSVAEIASWTDLYEID